MVDSSKYFQWKFQWKVGSPEVEIFWSLNCILLKVESFCLKFQWEVASPQVGSFKVMMKLKSWSFLSEFHALQRWMFLKSELNWNTRSFPFLCVAKHYRIWFGQIKCRTNELIYFQALVELEADKFPTWVKIEQWVRAHYPKHEKESKNRQKISKARKRSKIGNQNIWMKYGPRFANKIQNIEMKYGPRFANKI